MQYFKSKLHFGNGTIKQTFCAHTESNNNNTSQDGSLHEELIKRSGYRWFLLLTYCKHAIITYLMSYFSMNV